MADNIYDALRESHATQRSLCRRLLRAKAGYKVMIGDGPAPVTVVQGDGITTKQVKTIPVATGSRPSASSAGAGTMVYDSTLSKPIWSDGTNWRDAAGTIV